MPYSLSTGSEYAECPCCGKRANSLGEIEPNFGWRTMETGETIPQSYCRDCRSARCETGQSCKVNFGRF
ncbi:hypothetical protein [uncultured Clostridium sp.]|uniref:hypothetical protein n=1 Tax=uncultured Clostridium sp. TaxID=59620 RepID=UPI0026283F8E|nr:hypothetical protein [uncultured Clostridium sp.]